MSDIKTGGSAFPRSMYSENGPFHSTTLSEGYGMTLRDYFAARAMQADMTDGIHEDQFAWCAKRAYKMADAMLKAREA